MVIVSIIVMPNANGTELGRNAFWVKSQEEDVALSTDKSSYAVGEPSTVSWDDGPANRWDWIGVYEADASNPRQDDYLLWGTPADTKPVRSHPPSSAR